MGYFILLIVVIIVAFLVLKIIRVKRVNQTISCSEGQFTVYGTKQHFTIKKDKRFTFVVENGQIVSVKDKSASSKQIEYGRQ